MLAGKVNNIAVVATVSASGVVGGAEKFYQGLTNALNSQGLNADLINVISDEKDFDSIKKSYLRFYDLDVSKYDGIITTKAPGYAVRHSNHITYLQHTIRVFYDMFDVEFRNPSEELNKQRKYIQYIDTLALGYPRTKKIFVIGYEVKNRLLHFNNLKSEVLYQGLIKDNYYCNNYDYIFMPGRLHRWKRVDLAIAAMRYVKSPVKLKIAGTGEDCDYFKEKARGLASVEFLGYVEDDKLTELYSNSLAVVFIPIREDFGLITIEAFRSKKPVITCSDSGEPFFIVKNDLTGYICNPDPIELAYKIDYLYQNKAYAKDLGVRGFESIQHITWDKTATKLIEALDAGCLL
jgi:glycosyltransferase involved in cell wall biosynthesis